MKLWLGGASENSEGFEDSEDGSMGFSEDSGGAGDVVWKLFSSFLDFSKLTIGCLIFTAFPTFEVTFGVIGTPKAQKKRINSGIMSFKAIFLLFSYFPCIFICNICFDNCFSSAALFVGLSLTYQW